MPEGWKKSRWQAAIDGTGLPPELPETEAGEYMLDALQEAGTYRQTEIGIAPLEWSEIYAYSCATENISEPWERQAVMELSREFVAGYEIGMNPLSIAPFDGYKPVIVRN